MVICDVVVQTRNTIATLSAILTRVLIFFTKMQSYVSIHVTLMHSFIIAVLARNKLFRYIVDAIHVLSQVVAFGKVFAALVASNIVDFWAEFLVVDGDAVLVVGIRRVESFLAVFAIYASVFFYNNNYYY